MKATPWAQYMPAVFPPAMMFVNRAKWSGVGNLVRSMTMTSLKGSYFIVSWLIFAVFSVYCVSITFSFLFSSHVLGLRWCF